MPTRVGWLQREMEPMPHFVLYDEQANFIGRAKHVMLAPGHGPLSFPPVLAKARKDPALADRIVQAYEPKQYAPGGRYIVLGAGIASVNEWANILDVGGSVLALTRNPQPETQDLNVPRCLFESVGIDAYASLPFDQRIEFLGAGPARHAPRPREWLSRIEDGREEGRFDAARRRDRRDRARAGRPAGPRLEHARRGSGLARRDRRDRRHRLQQVRADDPAAAAADRVLQRAGRSTGACKLQTNCGVPGLDLPESRLCCMGLIANNVIPHGDTIAGLKYIGRRFVADCARAEKLKKRPVPVAARACRSRWAATLRSAPRRWPRPSSWRRGSGSCARPF